MPDCLGSNLPFTSSVTLGKLLNLPDLQLSPLSNGNDDSNSFMRLLWGINDLMHEMYLEQTLIPSKCSKTLVVIIS